MAFDLINPLYPRIAFINGSSAASGSALTVTTTSAVSFASTTITASSTLLCVVDVQSNSVYMTNDGTAPSGSTPPNGHLLAVGSNYTWQSSILPYLKFISAGSTSTATSYLYMSQWSP